MKEKNIKILAASTLAVSLAVGGAIFAGRASSGSLFNAKATDANVITLDSSTVTGLSSTASDGNFTTLTSKGSEVEWAYNSAKSSADALMALVRTDYGNNNGSEAYLANLSPITTPESVAINFTGSYVTLYGSINGVDFERVRTISASGTFTDLQDYFYFRVCSGAQDMSDVVLTSLSITYSCSSSRYNPEIRDLTLNVGSKIDTDDNDYPVAIPSEEVFDETRSTTSLSINQNFERTLVTSKFIWLKLSRNYLLEEVSHYKLVFWLKTTDDASFASTGDGSARDNFNVSIKLMNSSWKEASSSFATSDYKKGQSYIKVAYNLGSVTWKSGASNVSIIRISINRVLTAGHVYLDDFHLEETDVYPTMSYTFNYPVMSEENDLSNGVYTSCYGGSTDVGEELDYVAPAREGGSSTKSRKTTISGDWKMWNYEAMTQDFKNKSLTFDALVDESTVSTGKSANLIIQILINGVVYKTDNLLSTTKAGITRESVVDASSRTWVRITIDCVMLPSSATETPSTHLGFNFGYARTIYVDNMFVGNIQIAH